MNSAVATSTVLGVTVGEAGHVRRWLILPVLLAGTFLLLLDFSIVNVAMPSIRDSLRATTGESQLIIAFYAVAYSVLLITGGRLGDLFGRRAMFLGGMSGFVLTSVMCGLAPTIDVLIGGRLLQGVAAAVMSPQVLATIRVIFPAGERSRALGFYGATVGLGLVFGQLVGGILISLRPFGLTWQSIFLVNLPLGGIDLVLASWLFPRSARSERVDFDVPGVAVLSIGLVMLIYPLAVGREAGWPLWTLICLVLSAPVLAAFVLLERRLLLKGGSPLLDVRLFHDRAFSVGLALSFLVYASAAFYFCYAVYLQSGLGWSVFYAGLASVPYSVGFLFGSLAAPSLAARFGHGAPVLGYITGSLGLGIVVVILLNGGMPGGPMFFALAIAGLGLGIVFPSLIRIVLQDIPLEHAGMASGALNTVIQVGPALAVSIIGGIFFSTLDGGGATVGVYDHAFAVVVGCIILTFLMSLAMMTLLRPATTTFRPR